MSDLQISLLVLGALLVGGVYLFNWRQEREFRRKAEQAFTREHADVLLQDDAPDSSAPARVEPKLKVPPPPTARMVGAPPDGDQIDSVIDYVVDVYPPRPQDGADLHQQLLTLSAGWRKRVLAAGFDAASGDWVDAGHGRDFPQLRFALQMLNRAGCVEHGQLTAFRDAVLAWAQGLQADAKCLDTSEAHAMALELDRFCADVDIAIGVNVVAAEATPFPGTQIRALAEAAGLKLEPDGVFYAHDEDGEVLYTLDNHEPTRFVPEQITTLHTSGVTFLLDVPRVRTATAAFDEMLESARTFAAALNGVLVDDNRAALSAAAIDKIRGQLRAIVAKMEASQIAPGSARALRLFS